MEVFGSGKGEVLKPVEKGRQCPPSKGNFTTENHLLPNLEGGNHLSGSSGFGSLSTDRFQGEEANEDSFFVSNQIFHPQIEGTLFQLRELIGRSDLGPKGKVCQENLLRMLVKGVHKET